MARKLEHEVPRLGEKSGESPTPTRRPRLSLEQTRARVLEAAVARVLRDGLGSGLEHVRLEDAVRDADVSRTGSYRCWPRRDDFLLDVLCDLAIRAVPIDGRRGGAATASLRSVVTGAVADLATVDGRRTVLRDAVIAAACDELVADGEEIERWRLYLGLAMAAETLPAGEGRDRVREAVASAESRVLDRLVSNYRTLLGLFAFEPVVGYRELAEVVVAMMRGLAIGDMASAGSSAALVARSIGMLVDAGVRPADESVWDADSIGRLVDSVGVPDLFVG